MVIWGGELLYNFTKFPCMQVYEYHIRSYFKLERKYSVVQYGEIVTDLLCCKAYCCNCIGRALIFRVPKFQKGMSAVHYLGHVFSASGMSPDPNMMQVVLD